MGQFIFRRTLYAIATLAILKSDHLHGGSAHG